MGLTGDDPDLTIKQICLSLAVTTHSNILDWHAMPLGDLFQWYEDVNRSLEAMKE